MRFLIAGFGSIGRRHLRNLLALGERDIVLYRTHRSTLPTDEIEQFPTESSLEAALGHRPDAVIISNPTALHLSVAIPAARQGCHILMEKPISHDLNGLDELRRALQQGGGQLLMGFQFRFHPTLRTAAGVIAAGEIGRPLAVRAHWGEYLPNWHPWEDYRQSYAARPELGGGVILTLCHPFDYLRMIVGEINSVSAMTASIPELDLNLDAVAEILLGFQKMPHQAHPPADFERNWMFLAQMRHFLEVVRGEAEPLCTLADGERALQIALAALDSARQHREITL